MFLFSVHVVSCRGNAYQIVPIPLFFPLLFLNFFLHIQFLSRFFTSHLLCVCHFIVLLFLFSYYHCFLVVEVKRTFWPIVSGIFGTLY